VSTTATKTATVRLPLAVWREALECLRETADLDVLTHERRRRVADVERMLRSEIPALHGDDE